MDVCYNFCRRSGVVQLAAHGPLEPRILVRVQAPEPLWRAAHPNSQRTCWEQPVQPSCSTYAVAARLLRAGPDVFIKPGWRGLRMPEASRNSVSNSRSAADSLGAENFRCLGCNTIPPSHA